MLFQSTKTGQNRFFQLKNIMATLLNPTAYPEAYTKPPTRADALQSLGQKPGQLTKEQLEHFFTEGFVILENFLDTKLLDDIKIELALQVDDLAERLFKAGKIKNKHQDKDFFHRTVFLNQEFTGTYLKKIHVIYSVE
jgi:hypothetical protein